MQLYTRLPSLSFSLTFSITPLLSSLYLFSLFLSFYPAAPRAGGLTSATFSFVSPCRVPRLPTFSTCCTSRPLPGLFDARQRVSSFVRLALGSPSGCPFLSRWFSLFFFLFRSRGNLCSLFRIRDYPATRLLEFATQRDLGNFCWVNVAAWRYFLDTAFHLFLRQVWFPLLRCTVDRYIRAR